MTHLLLGALLHTWVLLAPAAGPNQVIIDSTVQTRLDSATEEYRWFHANPEVSRQEEQTAAHLAEAMRTLGAEVHTDIGGHGLVAILRGGAGPGPVILYRADMDALPITEATGLAYASRNPGVMHGCGHDIHMATAIGVMGTLASLREQWAGTVLFVGQPAEEVMVGARRMIGDPKFRSILRKNGEPSLALALHDNEALPAGDVALLGGSASASVDSVDIVLHGKGGHGARPHQTIDPVVMGAEVVMALQTIVSRRIPPDEKAVITVGKFTAGTKRNIIPPSAELLLTVRSYNDETRNTLLAEIRRVARSIAKGHRAPRAPEITVRADRAPAGYNDPAWTEALRTRFSTVLGKDHVHTYEPSMTGEDFGFFGTEYGVPSVMYRVGGVNRKRFASVPASDRPGLHSDRWAPDYTPTIETGMRTMTAAILLALRTAPTR